MEIARRVFIGINNRVNATSKVLVFVLLGVATGFSCMFALSCSAGSSPNTPAESGGQKDKRSRSKPDFSTPQNAMRTFSEAFEVMDAEGIVECMPKKIRDEKGERYRKFYARLKEAGGYFRVEFKGEDIHIDGDFGRVAGIMRYKKDRNTDEEVSTTEFVLFLENGQWRVNY